MLVLSNRLKFCVLIIFCIINIGIVTANDITPDDHLHQLHATNANKGYEDALISIIESIQKQNLEIALDKVELHLATFPKSREGHLLKADILQAMSGALNGLGQHDLIPPEDLKKFKHQLRNRLKHIGEEADKAHSLFPASLIALGEHKHLMVADMTNGRLYLYENIDGKPKLIRDYYLSIGSEGYGKEIEGDNRTPVGVYEINQYIEGKKLPDLYGKGAFPVNYPNEYDRFLKRTGYGIWLHGTPSNTYARAPWASEGCFVLSNDDLLDIGQYISVEERTPVILSDTIEWLDEAQYKERQSQYMAILNQWKQDWEALDVNAYLKHYSSENFNFGSDDYNAWAKRKYQVNKAKTFIQLDFDIQSLFVYPGDSDMFVVNFKQRYLSNNYSGESQKKQYWQKDSRGQWKIIFEG